LLFKRERLNRQGAELKIFFISWLQHCVAIRNIN